MGRTKKPTIKNRVKELRRVKISELTPNTKNWRKHPGKQREVMQSVLDSIGFAGAMLARETDDGLVLLDGHLRHDMIDDDTEVPVLVLDVNEEEADAILATYDPIGLLAGVDSNALDELVKSTAGLIGEIDTKSLLGKLSDVAAELGQPVEEPEIPEPPKKPVTKLGDVWHLGEHRLVCGDSVHGDAVKTAIGDDSPVLVVTSPPYWVGMEYEQEKTLKDVREFIASSAAAISECKTLRRICINTGTGRVTAVDSSKRAELLLLIDWWKDSLKCAGWVLRHLRAWAKHGGFSGLTPSPQSDVIDQHWEFLATFYDPSRGSYGQQRVPEKWVQAGVWDDIVGEARQVGHVASFPVEIPSRFIQLYTKEGDSVVEPFNGAGTTIVACEHLNRICYATDLSPAYCDVAVERWQNLTNKKATR